MSSGGNRLSTGGPRATGILFASVRDRRSRGRAFLRVRRLKARPSRRGVLVKIQVVERPAVAQFQLRRPERARAEGAHEVGVEGPRFRAAAAELADVLGRRQNAQSQACLLYT